MGSGGGTRTFAGTCLAGEDQDLEHLEKRRLQQMMMMMMVENLPIFAEKRQYIRGLAAELRGAKDWMKVATAGDEGIRLYTWQHRGQRPGERKLTAGWLKAKVLHTWSRSKRMYGDQQRINTEKQLY